MSGKTPPIWILALGALITGGFVAVLAGVIAVLSGEKPWAWAVGAFAVSGLLSWWSLLSWWQSIIEGKRQVQEAQKHYYPTATVRVRFEQNSGNWCDILELPVTYDDMRRAAVYLAGRNFQTSNLGGRGKPISRSQAEVLRDYFISRDLAEWNRAGAPTMGWAFKPAGRAIIKRFIPSPTPQPEVLPGNRGFTPARKHTQTHGGDY